jgi:SPP1 gp7 family putative phage head morphogenesis protein
MFLRIAKALHEGKLKPEDLDPELLKQLAEYLYNGVTTGIAESGYKPDDRTIAELKKSVYVFSGAKTYQALKDMAGLLTDSKGEVVSFNNFKQEALKVYNTYNTDYLRTEYNQAIASAQMASKWQQFQEDKDALPYLQFQTAGDAQVRAAHRALDGIIRHIDDDFWRTHYPPLAWGCRCDIIQVSSSKPKTTSDADLKTAIATAAVPDQFQFNSGIEKTIFPPKHPYYQVSKGVAATIEVLATKLS